MRVRQGTGVRRPLIHNRVAPFQVMHHPYLCRSCTYAHTANYPHTNTYLQGAGINSAVSSDACSGRGHIRARCKLRAAQRSWGVGGGSGAATRIQRSDPVLLAAVASLPATVLGMGAAPRPRILCFRPRAGACFWNHATLVARCKMNCGATHGRCCSHFRFPLRPSLTRCSKGVTQELEGLCMSAGCNPEQVVL